MFSCQISKIFKNTYFEEHLGTTADQMIYNKILLEKIRAMFHISIKFDLNVRKTGWKKIRFQLARLTASSHRPSSTEDSSTAKEQKLTKQCFLPHRFSTQSSQYQYWKARKYSILTVIELGPPVSESSTGSQQFMPPLILNTNFRKRKSKIGYPQDLISHS